MDNRELYEHIETTVVEESANNLMPDNSNSNLQINQIFNVKMPKPGKKKLIDESSVEKILLECSQVRKTKFSWAELWLGIATLLIGAFLSALVSQISYEFRFLSILFYSICPVVGVGCLVAYFFCKKLDEVNIKQFAEKIEEYLQNSDDQEEGESK